jgi:2-polyprenyl-3-methyl-5-hydroxy-6-metoxy-1,4-benzoquinol methylase
MDTAGRVCAADLDRYVAEIDRRGGLGTVASQAYTADFQLVCESKVDESLDPFSEEYFQQMLGLYREIAGRDLDQLSGELHPLDIEHHSNSANPYGHVDLQAIPQHLRTITAAIAVADAPHRAKVLDFGCGWGLTSEMLAYAGAEVLAVDINPLFVELVNRRAKRHSWPIRAVQGTFDDFTTDERFDVVFYYECFHHAVKPWETLVQNVRFLKPKGRLVLATEPVQATWWKHWGLRLDQDSVYCMRKYGWFESGWSEEFLRRCFVHAGLEMHVFPELGMYHAPVIVGLTAEAKLNWNPPAYPSLPYQQLLDSTQRHHELNLEVRLLKQDLQRVSDSELSLHSRLLHVLEQHHQLNESHHAMNLAHNNLSQRHQDLNQQFHDLSQQHHDFSQRHHVLSEQHQNLSQNHHDLSQRHHDLNKLHHDLNKQHHDLAESVNAERDAHRREQEHRQEEVQDPNKRLQDGAVRIEAMQRTFGGRLDRLMAKIAGLFRRRAVR